MKNRTILILSIFILFPIYFVSSKAKAGYFERDKKILDIEIGSDASKAKVALGNMTNNTEKFSSVVYDVWEYTDADGKLRGSLTIDPKTQKVVSKSVWVYAGEPEYNLNILLEKYFKQNKFDKYIPCHVRGQEEVLVDKERGVFIAARDGDTALVSWSGAELTKLRIEQFYEKCAKLQPPPKTGN